MSDATCPAAAGEREPRHEWLASIMRGTWPANLGSCFSGGTECCVWVCACLCVCMDLSLPISLCSLHFLSPCISHQRHLGIQQHAHTASLTHIQTSSSGLPWECLWHYVSHWGDAFNPETNLDSVLCVYGCVCVWACLRIKPNLTPIRLRLAAQQRHPTATPTWKSRQD